MILENSFPFNGTFNPAPNDRSTWIGAGGNRGGSLPYVIAGRYFYRVGFLLDRVEPATVTISGKLWVDRALTDIAVNGKVTDPRFYFAANGLTPLVFSLTNDFVLGWNTIDFVEENTRPGNSALRVEFESSGSSLKEGPPTILTEPGDQLAQDGGGATFSVVAAGRAPVSYEWFADGIPVGTNRTLQLSNQRAASHQTNLYTVVRNGSGSVTSKVAALRVSLSDRPPVPGNLRFLLFEDGALTNSYSAVVAAAVDPNHDVVKLFSFGSRSREGKRRGITNVTMLESSFIYRPVKEFSAEDEIAYSVTDGRDVVEAVLKIQVFSAPQSQTVSVGETAMFATGSSGEIAGYSYQWQWNGANLMGATNHQLFLPNVQLTQAGAYSVVVTNPAGSSTTSTPVQLVVSPKPAEGIPKVLADCSLEGLAKAAEEGGNYVLPCSGIIYFNRAIVVRTNLTLSGLMMNTLSGNKVTRLFIVDPGVQLSLKNLVLRDGYATSLANTNKGPLNAGTNVYGGAIWNRGGSLVLSNCIMSGNSVVGGNSGPGPAFGTSPESPAKGGSAFGGAIMSSNGVVLVKACAFVSNSAQGGDEGPQNFGTNPAGGGDGWGGAIYQIGGKLDILGSTFDVNGAFPGNTVASRYTVLVTVGGGAVALENLSLLRISDCGFHTNSANQALAEGGALYLAQIQSVSISNCTFQANSAAAGLDHWSAIGNASARGGALFLTNCIAEMNECFLLYNSAKGGRTDTTPYSYGAVPSYGGALYASGNVTIWNSTFYTNSSSGAVGLYSFGLSKLADGFGGAVQNAGDLLLVNCTLGANRAEGAVLVSPLGSPPYPPSKGHGGGLANSGRATIVHTTFAGNSAISFNTNGMTYAEEGGAIENSGDLSLSKSILAFSPSNNFAGALDDLGENISSDATPALTSPSSRSKTDPKLGPLRYYRGPTPTVPLRAGSPAIDAATPSSEYPTDQRGEPRPFGHGADIGAYEVTSALFDDVLNLSLAQGKIRIDYYAVPGATFELFSSTNFLNWGLYRSGIIEELGRASTILTLPEQPGGLLFKARRSAP